MIQFLRETKSSKLALWSVMLAMSLSVFFYTEIAYLYLSDPNRPHFSIVLALLMFLCYFGADVALNWREITTKRAA